MRSVPYVEGNTLVQDGHNAHTTNSPEDKKGVLLMPANTIDWAPLPKAETKRGYYNVLTVKAGYRIVFLPVVRKITGVWLHWNGRTIPCFHRAECPLCAAGNPRRWKGYIVSKVKDKNAAYIIEVTQPVAETIEAFAQTHGSLWNTTCIIYRANSKPNAKMIVECSLHAKTLPEPANPIDPTPSLLKLWGYHPTQIELAAAEAEGKQ